MKYEMKTENGYELFEASSALIKSLRRGLEIEALYWAREIETKFYNYVWKRLLIFTVEDVGFADTNAAVYVQALCNAYTFIKKNSQGPIEGDVLAAAVLYLARCPKSTEVDDFKNYFESQDLQLEIPEYAFDCHTQQGRKAGKTVADWYKDRRHTNGWEPNRYSELIEKQLDKGQMALETG